jgi:hypothetical protein
MLGAEDVSMSDHAKTLEAIIRAVQGGVKKILRS